MSKIDAIDTWIGNLYRDAPHLSSDAQHWLGKRLWWLTVIGVIVGILAIVAAIGLVIFALAVNLLPLPGLSMAWTSVILSAAVAIGMPLISGTLIMALAIQPLHARDRRGWRTLLLAVLVATLLGVIANAMWLNTSGVIASIIIAILGLYLLYEVKEYFLVMPQGAANNPESAVSDKVAEIIDKKIDKNEDTGIEEAKMPDVKK